MRGYLVKRDDRYYAVVYEGIDPLTHKERRTWQPAGTNRRNAERVLGELVQARNRRGPVFTRRVTIGHYLTEVWLPAKKPSLRPTTYARYEREITQQIVPSIGKLPLQRVRAETLDALYASLLERGGQRGAGLAPKTVLNIHLIISSALGDAARRDLIVRNEAKLAHPPKLRSRASRPTSAWTASELREFLESARSHRLWSAIYLAATTGMRRGEVLGLRWGDIDFAGRRVSIQRTLVAVPYDAVESNVKTRHSRRVVDLDGATIAVLGALRTQQTGPTDRDLVFAKPSGDPVHPHALSQAFSKLVARSGQPRIRFHDLRHTHATLLLKAGVPIKVVSERLGHASPAFTMATYQHVLPGMQAAAAGVFAELIAARDTEEPNSVDRPVEIAS